MARAVVVGHGGFAAGLVSAVREICGRNESFIALSNQDFPADALESRLREVLDSDAIRVVFTDLPGGSAAMAARRVRRDRPNLIIVTGTNLAALLEFAFGTTLDDETAARAAAAKAQAAIDVTGCA